MKLNKLVSQARQANLIHEIFNVIELSLSSYLLIIDRVFQTSAISSISTKQSIRSWNSRENNLKQHSKGQEASQRRCALFSTPRVSQPYCNLTSRASLSINVLEVVFLTHIVVRVRLPP